MKSPYIDGLVPNDIVTGLFLVLSKEIRQKKTGEPYLALHLSDRTGQIEAKMWDNVPEVIDTFDRDDFIKVKGLMQVYQNRSQFTVHRLRRLEEHEVELSDYFPCSDRNPDEMFAELQSIVSGLGNPYLRQLLHAVFADTAIATRYKTAPAAKTIHHACRGGLLEHVLSLCTVSRLVASHYGNLDLDLLLTGVILHDIGKIEELSYVRSFGYSTEGQLLGHIVIGLRILADKVAQVPDFPQKLRTLLEHMIISHHGELEFGSPKLPAFAEAVLLHHLDNMDSKMDVVRTALKRDNHIEGEFTGWIAPIERALLKKERFLNGPKPVSEAKPVSQSRVEPPVPEGKPAAPAPQNSQRPEMKQQPPASPEAPRTPGPPRPQTTPEPRPPSQERKPAPTTLFGEKLQAVLEPREPR